MKNGFSESPSAPEQHLFSGLPDDDQGAGSGAWAARCGRNREPAAAAQRCP
jgi:hypothetical protein